MSHQQHAQATDLFESYKVTAAYSCRDTDNCHFGQLDVQHTYQDIPVLTCIWINKVVCVVYCKMEIIVVIWYIIVCSPHVTHYGRTSWDILRYYRNESFSIEEHGFCWMSQIYHSKNLTFFGNTSLVILKKKNILCIEPATSNVVLQQPTNLKTISRDTSLLI